MEFRDLKEQYRQLKREMDAALLEAAASGAYIMGKTVTELEERLAAYVGVKHCVTCANGTDALTLALKAWGIGKGDAVFVPDFTFFSSAEVVALEGATPVFVDVEADSFNIDSKSLETAIAAVKAEGRLKPRVVVAVDLFGRPADYRKLAPIAEKNGLLLLEDGAQGFGGKIGEKRACSFGDIATTSFFPAKPLGCYGDGGAIFTDNEQWATLLRSYRVHGKGENKYDNVRIGLNSRLDTLQAAVLQVKLKAFEQYELEAVNTAAALYNEHLRNVEEIILPNIPQPMLSSWAQYTLRLHDKIDRTVLQARMKQEGIPTMVYYPTPMSEQTAFKEVKRYVETPVAHTLSQSVLSLPMHPYLKENDITFISQTLQRCLR